MMALALGLVGQPVQPYLTTGATDYVNSVQKGKEDAAKLKQADAVNQKSALDILSSKKKIDESAWATTNANDLKAKADKGELDAASIARMNEANPEFGKLLSTAQADAVKNFYASNLIGLNSATDQAGFLNDLAQAHEAHNTPLPESVRKDPKLAMQYYKVLLNGAKAFDDKTASMDESGNVITKDTLGNTTDIKPAAVKAAKATPVIKNGKRVTQNIKLPNGRTRTEQLMSDDTWQELDTSAPPAPKEDKAPIVKKPESPSGEESSSAGYAFRMGEANKIITDFETNKKGLPSYIPSMASGVPIIGDYLENVTQNEYQQLYRNAALAWIRAKLRDESGATIQDVESTNEYKTYFPVMGDTKAKIIQKAKLREIAEAEMMLKAGKASTKLEETRKNYNAKQPIKIKTREDYNRLKSGDVYLDPNGVKRTKS
jgi:hypothetical protein